MKRKRTDGQTGREAEGGERREKGGDLYWRGSYYGSCDRSSGIPAAVSASPSPNLRREGGERGVKVWESSNLQLWSGGASGWGMCVFVASLCTLTVMNSRMEGFEWSFVTVWKASMGGWVRVGGRDDHHAWRV